MVEWGWELQTLCFSRGNCSSRDCLDPFCRLRWKKGGIATSMSITQSRGAKVEFPPDQKGFDSIRRTSVRENLKKGLLYARSTHAYHQLTDDATPLAVRTGPLCRYPLDIRPRLLQGHFDRFDAAGLPIRRSREGRGGGFTTIRPSRPSP